jgi:hypothetical protein
MQQITLYCLLALLVTASIDPEWPNNIESELSSCSPVTCTSPKVPNAKGCKCICPTNQCTAAYQVQNRDTCECSCGYGRTLNPATSVCECVIQTCTADQTWNTNLCACKCNSAPISCPSGQRWNYKTCGCTIACP